MKRRLQGLFTRGQGSSSSSSSRAGSHDSTGGSALSGGHDGPWASPLPASFAPLPPLDDAVTPFLPTSHGVESGSGGGSGSGGPGREQQHYHALPARRTLSAHALTIPGRCHGSCLNGGCGGGCSAGSESSSRSQGSSGSIGQLMAGNSSVGGGAEGGAVWEKEVQQQPRQERKGGEEMKEEEHWATLAAKACLGCRLSKAKCDRAIPSCSRCVRRRVKCQQELEPHQLLDQRNPLTRQLNMLYQLVYPEPHFQEYARIFSTATREMQEAGRIGRGRAINTLRLWYRERERRNGQDITYGALDEIMSLLHITVHDLTSRDIDEDLPQLGGLPLLSLVPNWRSIKFKDSALFRSLDPTIPTLLGGGPGIDLLWMNRAAEKHYFKMEVVKLAFQRSLGWYFMGLAIAPNDRPDILRMIADICFGIDTSITNMAVAFDKHGHPVLRFGRIQYAAIPEHNVTVLKMTFQDVPTTRFTPKRVKKRNQTISRFRLFQRARAQQEAEEEEEEDEEDEDEEGYGENEGRGFFRKGGGSEGEGAVVSVPRNVRLEDDDGDHDDDDGSGAKREEEEQQWRPLLPMTTMGAGLDEGRLAVIREGLEGGRHESVEEITRLFQPPSSSTLISSGTASHSGGGVRPFSSSNGGRGGTSDEEEEGDEETAPSAISSVTVADREERTPSVFAFGVERRGGCPDAGLFVPLVVPMAGSAVAPQPPTAPAPPAEMPSSKPRVVGPPPRASGLRPQMKQGQQGQAMVDERAAVLGAQQQVVAAGEDPSSPPDLLEPLDHDDGWMVTLFDILDGRQEGRESW